MGFFEGLKVLDAAGKAFTNIDPNSRRTKLNIKSISSAANATTFIYPTLFDEDIPRDDIEILRKGLEVQYAHFTKSMTALFPAIELNEDMPDIRNYIQKFHKDLGFESGEFITDILGRIQESSIPNLFEQSLNLTQLPYTLKKEIMFEAKWKYKERDGSENPETGGTDDRPTNEADERRKNNEDIRKGKKRSEEQRKADDDHDKYVAEKERRDTKDKYEDEKNARDNEKNKRDKRKAELDEIRANDMRKNDSRRAGADEAKAFEDLSTAALPTTINAEIKVLRTNGEIFETHVPLQIKAYARVIGMRTFEKELTKCLGKKGGVFSFITWLSGEKGTLKDNIIGINDIKDEAIKAAKSGDSISQVKHYKRLAKLSISKLTKGLLPQSSFIISMNLAERLKSATGKDLTDSKTVRKLIDDYHLLSFVVTDGETAYITFHGRGYTDIVPMNALKRAKGKDNSMDQMLKLFKMIR